MPFGQISLLNLGCLLSPRFAVGNSALFGSMALKVFPYFFLAPFNFFFGILVGRLFASNSLFCRRRRFSFDSEERGGD
jgi:hypothetical protein